MVWRNSGRAIESDGTVLPVHGTVQEDTQWLPPTLANLARLSVTIPAGYRRVHSVTSESRAGIRYFVAGPGH